MLQKQAVKPELLELLEELMLVNEFTDENAGVTVLNEQVKGAEPPVTAPNEIDPLFKLHVASTFVIATSLAEEVLGTTTVSVC